MSEPDEKYQAALDKFLHDNPVLHVQLDTLNPLLAQARGETQQEYRAEQLHAAFEAEAERLGLFAWELTLQLTANTPEEFQQQRLEVHKEVAEMAGLDWAQYCQLHGLKG